jgi:hypothetical protein
MTHQQPRRGGQWLQRALRVAAASIALAAAVAAPAQLVPSAMAAGGEHGGSHESAPSSGSGEKSGGGGVGSTVNKVTCGAQNIVNRVTLGFFGSPCSSSSGGVDPVQATSSILKQTFGGLAVAASPLLTGTLTQVPDFASQSGGVVALERSTTAIGFAIAGLVLTLSILRFALAGVSASGGFEGAEGVTRTLVAVLAMLGWPWLFHNLAALMNTVTNALLSTSSVHVALIALVGVGGVGAVLFATHSKIGWIFGIVILGLEALLMIGLLLMKVLLAGATTLIFVAMPLALALWPLRETSWIAGRLAHVLFVAVATPLIWALIFATAAVMGGSVFGLHGGFWDTILIRPLAAMSMFVLALLAPLMLLRHAHGGIGHPVGRLAGYASMRLATNAVSAQLPERLGGRRSASPAPFTELQLPRDPAGGTVNGRESPGVRVVGDASDPVQAFLDGESNPDARGAAAGAFPPPRHNDVGRIDDDQASTAPMRAGAVVGAASRPKKDAESFAFRDPGRLSFADSLAAERVKARAGHGEPSVIEGQAALESFTPRMQARIRDQYELTAPASGGEARVDGSAFRAMMAASALSEDISDRQAGALGVLAGLGDDRLSTLFADPRGAVFAGGGPPAVGGPRAAPARPDGKPHGEGRPTPSLGHLAAFEDELSQTRLAPLVVEQPAPPAGRE